MNEIKYKVLKAIYENLNEDTLFDMPIDIIQKDSEIMNIKFPTLLNALELLNKEEILSYRRYTEDSDFIVITIELRGLLSFEKENPNGSQYYTNLTFKLLNFLKNVEDKKIQLEPGEGRQTGKLSKLAVIRHTMIEEGEYKKFINILSKSENVFSREVGWTNKDGFLFYGPLNVYLTPEGRDFLNEQNKLKNLFQNVSDSFGKQVVLQEYKDMKLLLEHCLWKDVLIKMGSIIEYLITDYFEYSGLARDAKNNLKHYQIKNHSGKRKNITLLDAQFGDKLSYIIQNTVFGRKCNNDWKLVDNNVREYRNYVHLSKVVQDKMVFDGKTVQLMFPIFERVIILF